MDSAVVKEKVDTVLVRCDFVVRDWCINDDIFPAVCTESWDVPTFANR